MAPPEVSRLPQMLSHPLARPQSPWTHKENNIKDEEEDSWEVRAFAEDTASGMGTVWPPRSYTCSFCGREFRSAQALGGHMNVHRHDRARLHHNQNSLMKITNSNPRSTLDPSSSISGNSSLLIPTQEFLVNGELCLIYRLHDHNPNSMDPNTQLHAISPYPVSIISPSFIESYHKSSVTKGEVDLELRLGQGPTTQLHDN